jgi:hypothetical protein
MHKLRSRLLALSTTIAACSSGGIIPSTAVQPLPNPAAPAPQTATSHTLWSFNPQVELHKYRSTNRTTLQMDYQSTAASDTLSVLIEFTATANQTETQTTFAGQIETISVKAWPRNLTEVPQISLPVGFNGIATEKLVNLSLNLQPFETRAGSPICGDPGNTILGELRNYTAFIPLKLASTSIWADTISTVTCSGNGIPSTLETTRSYRVIGEANQTGSNTILLERTQTTHLTGDGAQGQHQIKVTGEGTGISKLYLDAVTGLVILVKAHDELTLKVIASGQVQQFSQRVDQSIDLVH